MYTVNNQFLPSSHTVSSLVHLLKEQAKLGYYIRFDNVNKIKKWLDFIQPYITISPTIIDEKEYIIFETDPKHINNFDIFVGDDLDTGRSDYLTQYYNFSLDDDNLASFFLKFWGIATEPGYGDTDKKYYIFEVSGELKIDDPYFGSGLIKALSVGGEVIYITGN